jgi:hypothetical protein
VREGEGGSPAPPSPRDSPAAESAEREVEAARGREKWREMGAVWRQLVGNDQKSRVRDNGRSQRVTTVIHI